MARGALLVLAIAAAVAAAAAGVVVAPVDVLGLRGHAPLSAYLRRSTALHADGAGATVSVVRYAPPSPRKVWTREKMGP